MTRILFLQNDSDDGKVRTTTIELTVYPEEASSLQDAIALMQKLSVDFVVSACKPTDRNWCQVIESANGASSGSAVVVVVENGQDLKTIPVTFLALDWRQISSLQTLRFITEADQPDLPELLSGMRRTLRQESQDQEPDLIDVNGLRLDGRTQEVAVRGRLIPLTALEFKLLHFLASHPHEVFSRRKLLGEVWDQGRIVSPRTVDVHMRRLREKIEKSPGKPSYLITVRGSGYRFVPNHDKRAA